MRIGWDERKRLANQAKHGLDFADLTLEFFAEATILPAKKGRFQAIGPLRPDIVVVIAAALGSEGVSIISLRPASRKERSFLQ